MNTTKALLRALQLVYYMRHVSGELSEVGGAAAPSGHESAVYSDIVTEDTYAVDSSGSIQDAFTADAYTAESIIQTVTGCVDAFTHIAGAENGARQSAMARAMQNMRFFMMLFVPLTQKPSELFVLIISV
ncbi:MAG: hypothetical protein II173_04335 [Firmicutes bacterium]|nr:hypothetical protein [Bacillota bacterium]